MTVIPKEAPKSINKKVVMQFIVLTFSIAVIFMALTLFFGLFGFSLNVTSVSELTGETKNSYWLYIFVLICAFSPTIASYVVLKKNKEVSSFKEWLKNVFDAKCSGKFYLLVFFLYVTYQIPQLIMGLEEAQPLYMFLVVLPLALLAGGLEEAGWSYILRQQLDKKYGLIVSSTLIAVIWALWHIPVFLPQGRLESLVWFITFAISCLGQSFALGAISRITKNVFLCVLFHTICNAGSMTFIAEETLTGNLLITGILITVSIILVSIYERENKKKQTGK